MMHTRFGKTCLVRVHYRVTHITGIVLVGLSVMLTGWFASDVQAQQMFRISADSGYIPTTALSGSEAGVSQQQVALELSVFTITAHYTLTSFAWEHPEDLPLGNGDKAPWEDAHRLTAQAMFGGDIAPQWSYVLFGLAEAGFESTLGESYAIDQSFQESMLMGGVQYAVSDRLRVLGGGGVLHNNFKTQPLPVGGVQWESDFGVDISVIFPVESKITYTSSNTRFSAYVDAFPNTAADMAYRFSPEATLALHYTLSDSDTFRLSDRSPVDIVQDGNTYVKAETQKLGLILTYAPVRNLTCQLGVSYLFGREFSMMDDEEDRLKTLNSDNAIGGLFSLAYTF